MVKKIDKKISISNYLSDPNKRKVIGEIIFYGFVWGSLINYSLIVFGVPFKLFSFPAYGILLYLTKSQLVRIWRNLFFKYENIGVPYI